MSDTRLALWSKGLALGSAFAALILLAVFYSVVSSAVDRAASRRAEAMTPVAPQLTDASSHRPSQSPMPSTGLVLVGTTR